MYKGDLSNQPSKVVVVPLEAIVDEVKVSKYLKRLTIRLDSHMMINKFNKLVMNKDVQLEIMYVGDYRLLEAIEERLDAEGLIFKDVVIVEDFDALKKYLDDNGYTMFTSDPAHFKYFGFLNIAMLGELFNG